MKLKTVICGSDEREVWLHRTAYCNNEFAEVSGICCDEAPAIIARAEEWGCEIYEDFDDVLKDRSVKIIVIPGSGQGGAERVIEALGAGKHVLVSPPFANSAEEAKRIADVAKKSKGQVMCCDNRLFYPPVRKVLSIIKKKSLGRVTAVRMRSLLAGSGGWDPYLNPDFAAKKPQGKPDFDKWLFREFFEKLSLAHKFLGPIEEMFCIRQEESNSAVLTWKHTAPATYGALEAAYAPDMNIRSAYYPRDDNVELTGGTGILWLTLACSQMKTEPTVKIYRGENQFAYGNLDDDWIRGYELSVSHFAECAAKNRTPSISVKTSVRIVEYAAAAVKSASSGERIRF